MKKTILRKAINEAKRFISRGEIYLKKYPEDDEYIYASKESGSVKRASMDLTRVLADLRQVRR